MKFLLLLMVAIFPFSQGLAGREPLSKDPMGGAICENADSRVLFEIYNAPKSSFEIKNLQITTNQVMTVLTAKDTVADAPISNEDFLPFVALRANLDGGGNFKFFSKDGSSYFLILRVSAQTPVQTFSCEVYRTKPGVIISN
jgi:hypothetical protein